mmetsp:Transcript_24287/g.50881  ORF Transcript_24287/g.50881 Transcript_24287/m.50881 type:complete len:328 (-) Transcript_24287:236-1219(-)
MTSAPKNTMHTPPDANTGALALQLDEMKLMAEQEYCEIVFANKSKPASFRKYDTISNTYVRINVWCDSSAAGIVVDHPRQGKMQTLLSNVDKKLMREIFRSPRQCAGYPELKRPGANNFAIGDMVQVNGYGLRGCARIVRIRDHMTGLVKIQFGDGQEYRVDVRQLTKARSGPKPQPARFGKCQTLKNEARLQLKRLDREQEKLQQERQALLKLQAELLQEENNHNNSTAFHHLDDRVEYCPGSPTSFTRMNLPAQEGFGQADSLEFADANLESILTDSGAFALPPATLIPAPPSPLSHNNISQDQNQNENMRMILPPHNYQGFFNV